MESQITIDAPKPKNVKVNSNPRIQNKGKVYGI